ncbi:Large cysteine-rich periplasmic protein OmcB [Thermoflexales bacterium]|nr:Large cysteine-rich periplasmic protein OmcB [Thermoflexales bacterium]
MFTKFRIVLLVCVVALLIQAPASTFAQSGEPPVPVVLSEDAAYRNDAEAYVAAFGGTIDEAVRRLKLQGPITQLDAVLQTQEKTTFAGLWIEHTPRFRVVAQFTQGGEETVLPYIQNGPLTDLVEVQTVPISLEQLRVTHSNVIRDIQATDTPAESDIDLKANRIKVYITGDTQQLEATLSVAGHPLPSNVQIVEVAQLSQPMSDWYAGYDLSGCTSGFSLWNAAYAEYSSTAGHCVAPSYSPLGAPIFSMIGGAYDFQVNPAPSDYTIKNWAADNIFDSTPYYREITSWWATASVGTVLCKFGKTTRFTCGIVESNNYNYQGSPTWLLIASTNPEVRIACPGDSGSPVYNGSTAVGEAVAGWCDLSELYNKVIVMPAGKYTDYGYYIMTAPTPPVLPTDLSITGTDAPDPVITGETLTYLLTIQNVSNAVGDADVVDTLPPNVTFLSVTPSQLEDPVNEPCTYENAQVWCDLGDIAPGDSATMEIVVQVNAGAGTVLTNQAEVDAGSRDQNDSNDHVTLTTSVMSNQADLSISIADSSDPVISGNNLTYILSVHNAGPQSATNVLVSQALPANGVFQSATSSQGTCSGTGPISCALGNLVAGANAQITVVVKVNASASGQLNSTATVAASTPDPNNGNNTDTESTQTIQRANLGLTLVDTPDPVVAGTRLTYTLSVNNTGPSNAASVQVTDTWLSGVTYVSAATSQGACTFNTGERTLTCSLGTLAVNASAQIILVTNVAVGTVGTIIDIAGVTSTTADPTPANNAATQNTAVIQRANLGLTLADTPDPVVAGTRLTYTLSVNNAGPSNAASVQVTDTWPSGVSYVSAITSQGTCTPNTGTRTVTCNLGTLAVNAGAQISLVTTVNPGTVGTIVDSAGVTSTATDPVPTNNYDAENTTVTQVANLGLTLIDTPDPVIAGTRLTYTLSVNNAGPSNATSVQVTDTWPSGVLYTSVMASQGSCTHSNSLRTITCTLGTLAANANAQITLVTTVRPGTVGTIVDTARVTSMTADPMPANNSATQSTTVIQRADLSLALTSSAFGVKRLGHYYLAVDNWGPSNASTIVVTDTVSSDLTIVAVSGTGWTCTRVGQIVTCQHPGPALANANLPRIDITIRPKPAAVPTVTNTASLSSATIDPVPANNQVQRDTVVKPLPLADFDGNGYSDVAVWRPSNGTWYRMPLIDNGVPITIVLGAAGDIPVAADYNGDGFTDYAVFSPEKGAWYLVFNNGFGDADVPPTPIKVEFGQDGDIPVPADYNGDGLVDIAVFRPDDGSWLIRYEGQIQPPIRKWGQRGDIPVPADYNGDGSVDLAFFRPSDGGWYVITNPIVTYLGQAGDIPVPADYNQDGLTECAVFRPSTGNWHFLQGITVSFGQPGDIPVPADYDIVRIAPSPNAQLTVFRPSTGSWFFYNLADPIAWGQLDDIPASARPEYPNAPGLQ